eukprot:m.55527 g.55527  ORF g.55527 m.55527 type:complete len:205 (-) comp22091_c0_seq3:100-714(-)
MGIVFGVTGSKEPAFTVIKSGSGYEVRKYGEYFLAEYKMPKPDSEISEKRNHGFGVLAKYIGVFGKPTNSTETPMAMTAPVITNPTDVSKKAMSEDKIAMKTMSFVLPFEFTDLASIPKPTDDRISIRKESAMTVAVVKFSGWFSDSYAKSYLNTLCTQLREDKLLGATDEPEWSVAQYHPPFTLPFLRRNEIWVTLDDKHLQE